MICFWIPLTKYWIFLAVALQQARGESKYRQFFGLEPFKNNMFLDLPGHILDFPSCSPWKGQVANAHTNMFSPSSPTKYDMFLDCPGQKLIFPAATLEQLSLNEY